MLRRHVSLGWLLHICTATQEKTQEFFSGSYNVSIIESRVSGNNKTLPCTTGRMVQIQHLPAASSSCVCHSQGAPCRASQVPGCVGWCLQVHSSAEGGALQAGLCPQRLHHSRGFAGTREQLIRQQSKERRIFKILPSPVEGLIIKLSDRTQQNGNPRSNKPWPWKARDAKFRMELLWLDVLHSLTLGSQCWNSPGVLHIVIVRKRASNQTQLQAILT